MITSKLFEAYLACPRKCYFLSIGKLAPRNEYTAWYNARRELYRINNTELLLADSSQNNGTNLDNPYSCKNEAWDYVLSAVVKWKNVEATPHVVQRIPSEKHTNSILFVPLRYIPENKLSDTHKLMSAFDAVVLSRFLGAKTDTAKIVHGEKRSTFTVKAHALVNPIRKLIYQITTVISARSSPALTLNKHCPECEFHDLCNDKAIEMNELTLLAGLPGKEKIRLNNKGIFTVNQLSYTFRPRRRSKRLAEKPERNHPSLKALAIRERKIHVVGYPQLRIDGTPIYFDVEGIPDNNFYYLVGIRFERNSKIIGHYFWANTEADEKLIWRNFLTELSGFDRPVLIHYGSYETKFLKRMCKLYGGPPEGSSMAIAISSSINILKVIYSKVYFPTYSNGLKEIGNYLGFQWGIPSSSGLMSIAWRHQWEISKSPALRKKLIAYNAEDCEALNLVTNTLIGIIDSTGDKTRDSDLPSEIVNTDTLRKNLTSKWGVFKSALDDFEHINEAAHWDYQRDRVFVRMGVTKRKKQRSLRANRCLGKPEKIVNLMTPTSCPICGKRGRTKFRFMSRTVQDLVFGRDSIKRRIVQYQFQSYRCRSCGNEYGFNKWYFYARKWGWNMVSYFIYHIVSLSVPQLTMQHNLKHLFGFNLARSTLNNLKIKAANEYLTTKQKILERIISGKLIHADETRANIKGSLAYVWVLTNLKEVVYILSESREGVMIQELLKDFNGVLITDFYAAYESIECPQQKCLIHLMRDLNNEILNNPFDEEFKSIAIGFSGLLKPMIDTIDRFGLKKRYLRKHLKEVNRFYKFLEKANLQSEVSKKCKQRFVKNKKCLFTFLFFDGIPWNNNNAEHAIKAFARLRDVIGGSSTKKGVDEYLTLLSVAQTCAYQEINFLAFLRSEEKDVNTFVQKHCKHSVRAK